MPDRTEDKRPAQAPGDAESPQCGETDPTIEKAIRHSDATEPVQGNPKQSDRES